MEAKTVQFYNEYIKQNLVDVPELSEERYPYGRFRGYVEIKTVMRRRDNTPIQEQDIEALRNIQHAGQSHFIRGKAGATQIEYHCTIDSTD